MVARIVISFVVCFISLFFSSVSGQKALIDSLLGIEMNQRDTSWVDTGLNGSYGVVYNDPELSADFLDSIRRLAELRFYDSRLPRIYLNQGIAQDVMNQPDSALYFYSLGLSKAQERGDTTMIAAAYNNIGLIHWNSERLDSALINYKLSEDLFKIVNNQQGLISTLNNIGLIYQSLKRDEESRDYFQRVIRRARESDMPYFLAVGHQNIATAFTFKNMHDSVHYHLKKAIPIQIEINDLRGLSKSYHTLATSLNDLKKFTEAKEYFEKAIDANKKLGNQHALASNYYGLASIYRQEKKPEKNIEMLEAARNLRGEYDDIELKNKVNIFYNLAILRPNDATMAYEFGRAFTIKDSIYEARLEGKIVDLQEEYEAEKRERELLIKSLQIADQEQAALQRERLLWGLVTFVFILIIFGFLFVRYRSKLNKLKTQQQLATERSRISRDLHDNIGAQLTAMSTRIDLLDDGKNHTSELAQIRDEATDTVSMLRDTIWAMHREEFTVPQFMGRIRQYAQRVLPAEITLDLNFDKKLETKYLNASEALNLFRIAQEAIQNCTKHSDASEIFIRLSKKFNQYEFLISDNGNGCRLAEDSNSDSYGLQNIRERSAEIKGRADFESDKGAGFAVRVAF